ncbi:50S ribosomal protein L13 [PVC group bacterium (ex Bugula neritina AB1)]|nr:50S ribosomal protein L13 [PVC group bacterium (ex Bugula neritina AB1)]
MKTKWIKPSEIEESWYQVDAEQQILGRLVSQIAFLLLGKNDVRFVPGIDFRNYVIVTNAQKVAFTGKKLEQKMYYHHTGYTGHLKTATLAEKMAKNPEDVMKASVKGMLPSNKLGRNLLKHLKVYASSEHDHQAQKPEIVVF